MIPEHYTHQLSHLTHLHEKWCQFIYERAYKEKGTVLVLGTLANHRIFDEFISAGTAVLKMHFPKAEVTGGWATLVRSGIQSDWHDHLSASWVFVYYPKHQPEQNLLIGTEEDHITVPCVEGNSVMYRGTQMHKIGLNPGPDIRYSLVLTAKEKR